MLAIVVAGATLCLAGVPISAAELKVGASDTVESVLAAQKGKKVTLRLRSGQETGGTVAFVSAKLVQLSAVSGKEFFDAVVPLDAIEAVFVRTKD
jgi:hypothetical protein